MHWPSELQPTDFEQIAFSDDQVVQVQKAKPLFTLWPGKSVADTYNGKPILDFQGRPGFAELVILWSFEAAGWVGAWMDSYRRRTLRGYWPEPVFQEIPPRHNALLQNIAEAGAGESRPWDVFCWSPEAVIFVEAKRAKHDQIRRSQVAFLKAALETGVPASAFLLVEWAAAEHVVAADCAQRACR